MAQHPGAYLVNTRILEGERPAEAGLLSGFGIRLSTVHQQCSPVSSTRFRSGHNG